VYASTQEEKERNELAKKPEINPWIIETHAWDEAQLEAVGSPTSARIVQLLVDHQNVHMHTSRNSDVADKSFTQP